MRQGEAGASGDSPPQQEVWHYPGPDAGSWHIDVLMFKNIHEFVDFRYCVSIPGVLKQLFVLNKNRVQTALKNGILRLLVAGIPDMSTAQCSVDVAIQ